MKELPKFTCEMWVSDDGFKSLNKIPIHGYIPTLDKPWIDLNSEGWKNASLTDPRIEEVTIEQAERLLGKKIRR